MVWSSCERCCTEGVSISSMYDAESVTEVVGEGRLTLGVEETSGLDFFIEG